MFNYNIFEYMGHITKIYLTKKKDVLVHNAWENSPTRPEKTRLFMHH